MQIMAFMSPWKGHKYTDEKQYFVSESSAYRILKAADLITAPDYVVIKAAEEFKDNGDVTWEYQW